MVHEVFNGKQSQFLEEFYFCKLGTLTKYFCITVDNGIEQDIIMKCNTSDGLGRYTLQYIYLHHGNLFQHQENRAFPYFIIKITFIKCNEKNKKLNNNQETRMQRLLFIHSP